MTRVAAVAASALVCCAACGPPNPGSAGAGTWVGTITTEGDVTTVINESGSVWGGTAELVEEASIGVESGPDEYMLGSVSGIALVGDNIVIADPQVPVVRVYDLSGRYIRDLGREGQGPGEYRVPMELGSATDSEVIVKDGNRILKYTVQGEALATWTVSKTLGFSMIAMPLVVTEDGVPHAPVVVDVVSQDSDTWKWGMLPILDNGIDGDPVPVPEARGPSPLRLTNDGGSSPVPFSNERVWALAPSGAMVAGNSAEYRYTVQDRAGATLVVEKAWDPIPIQSAEARWYKERQLARLRSFGEDWTWNGPEVPPHKPAFNSLQPDPSGRVWVPRHGPGRLTVACAGSIWALEDDVACWSSEALLDVFDADGRFRGAVTVPDGMRFRPRPFIRDETVLAVVEDDVGTIMVKRYRLVLLAEEEQ